MNDEYISHYGVKRRSGRYPWGSGDEPYQRGSENTVNGVARKLDNRDLVGASKSLGISNKKMSNVMSDQAYTRSGEILFKGNVLGGFSMIDTNDDSYDPLTGLTVPSYHGQPSSPDRKPANIPSHAKWDEDKKMWGVYDSVAYWNRDTEKWVTVGDTVNSRIYYDEVNNRWLTEDGDLVSEESKYENSQGERYRPKDIPESAKWNSVEKRWEINVPDPPKVRTNKETGDEEAVVWDEYTQSFVPAEWNKKTKRWEPIDVSKQTSSLFIKNKQRRQTKTEKKESGVLSTLQSALTKMGSFFKRKISDIIDKFDD